MIQHHIEEMLFALEVSEDDFEKEVTEERLLDFIQFTLNAVRFLNGIAESGKYMVYKATDSVGKAIWENCRYVTEKLGAEIRKEKNEIYLVYKDDIAAAVSNEFPEIGVSITEYQKIDYRGDLKRKAEVLCTLAKRLEPFEKALVDAGFKRLCTDTTFLLNKVARHELKDKDPVDARFKAMDNKTLEEWCDRTFKFFIGCMAVLPYVEMRPEINALKKD